MARNSFKTTLTGNKDILKDLDHLINDFPEITKKSLEAQQEVVADAIRRNWVSIASGKNGDFVYDSIGKNAETGVNGVDAIGMVGVFNIDRLKAKHDRKPSSTGREPMNAPQIAYWVEFGTSRLKIHRGTKKKNFEYNEEDLIQISAKPFITNAFYSTLTEQQDAFYKTFNKLVKK